MKLSPTCKNCSQTYIIEDEDMSFYEKISPTLNGKTHIIPPPTLCPNCRLQRKLSFRNERSIHRRTCNNCQKSIISIYSPENPYNIYCSKCWWSDAWSPLDYGRDFDFSKTFAENFSQLWKEIPCIGLWLMKDQNSEYNNCCYDLKDSYMNFCSDMGENIFYNYIVEFCKDMTDCAYAQKSEICYECIDVTGAYQCFFSQDLENCQDCYFSSDLIGCRKCFGCHGLRHKEGYIFNKKVSDQEWDTFMKVLRLTRKNIQHYKKESKEVYLTMPKKTAHISQCADCTGDYLRNCKNCKNCFDHTGGEDNKNVIYGIMKSNNVHDSYAFGDLQWAYDIFGGGIGVSTVAFCHFILENVTDVYYSVFCQQKSNNLFGCMGLRQKQYCVLNKQYNKEEYEILVAQIIEHMKKTGEWGESFSPSISPYGYNESHAQECFPLTKEEALKKGYRWSDYETPISQAQTIKSDELPEDIHDITDDILTKAIECEITKKPFKITKQELEFYRNFGLSLPRRHPDQRHRDRMSLRNPRKLFERNCMKCSTPIQTTYSPNRPEIVYCEKCYLEAVY